MTKAEREENRRIAALGCLVETCRMPAVIHHWREENQRRSTAPKIPLCPLHHDGGKYGVSFHAGKKMWIATFGDREYFIALRDKRLQEER